MGVSFQISRTGRRFQRKPREDFETSAESSKDVSKNESNNSTTSSLKPPDGRDEDVAGLCRSSLSSRKHILSSDHEVSFTLNLFTDGYSIGKPSEGIGHHTSVHEAAKLLHPYDRASEKLFSGIESGWLPGDILDDIPCKYVDGGLVCEVRDFRKCISDSDSIVQSAENSPTTTKVHLQMSLENVVKDIASMADDSWTYGDLMEVESRILKALQPKLSLDPTPRLDKLCQDPVSSKLNLHLSGLRRKRLREMPDITVTSSSRLHGKKISVGRLPDNSSYRLGESVPSDTLPHHMHGNIPAHNFGSSPSNLLTTRSGGFLHDSSVSAMNAMSQHSKFGHGVGNKRSTQDSLGGTVLNTSIAFPVAHETSVYNDNVSSTSFSHGKMELQEGQMSPYSGKRARLGSMTDNVHSQQIGPYMDSLGPDVQWKNQFSQHQENAREIQYPNTGMSRYPQLGNDGAASQDGVTVQLGQQAMKYGMSGDQIEADKLDNCEPTRLMNDGLVVEAETNHLDPRFQQRTSQSALMRSNFHPTGPGWNNLGQQVEKDPRKEEHNQKRKAHSPRVSSSIVSQSHFSGKSADPASGSLGIPYGAMPSAAPLGYLQREKSSGLSIPSVRSQSGMSNANETMHQQAQAAGKWRTNSLPKTPAMSGIGSPVSISNMSMHTNAGSPSVSTGTMVDQSMLEKFSKIETVATRFKLNCKRTKAEDLSRKPHSFSPKEVMNGLSNFANNEAIKDDPPPLMPMSKSLVGGNLNTLKIRVMTFSLSDRTAPGNAPAPAKMRTRLIMSEKPHDGTVAMHFGDLEDRDYLNAEDHLPSLPTPHFADMLASQFCTLMLRDGYYMEEYVQARPPPRAVVPPPNQPNVPSIPSSVNESQQYAEAASAPQYETKPIITPNATTHSPPNLLSSTGMPSPGGNPLGLQMPQGLLHGASAPARPQQLEIQQSIRQQHAQLSNQQQMGQQHQSQFSRSILLPPNSHPNALGQISNLPLSSQMANKTSPLHMMQQQNVQHQSASQPQLQSQMQRKMMMGLGTGVGMGNLTNNMAGLGALGNVIGMGGARVTGGVPGVSSSMGPNPGMGNMTQNTMQMNQGLNFSNTISQHLRSGTLGPQAQAILATRMRLSQNRGMLGPQSGIAGMPGARQMQGNPAGHSMLNQTLNRGGNINPMQRPAMAAPRLMTGMNVHMNQQQQQQMLQLQQLQQMQQQQQQQQSVVQQPQSVPEPQQQLHQQEASPLQSVVSPQQVSSPSTLGIPQQINQPGVVQQQPSPQMSSGAIHPTSISNPEAGPASPQVSSQTLGSVGSISNSPMDLQGVNKKNNS